MLAEIEKLAPQITSRTAEIEAGRRIPPDLVEALRSIGVFRMFAPRNRGGLELDLPAALDVFRALARIDGSVGWSATIASGCDVFAALLPRKTYDRVYQEGPDVILAGSAQPAGTADAVDGGWRVNGRWPFASGCQHAAWIFGFCAMTRNGQPIPGPAGYDGPPLVQGFVLPASDWQIEDTWHVAGLKGTGSHHITIKDVFVPAVNFFDVASGTPCQPGPLYQAVRQILPLMHGAICVGIAEGALDEIVALANSGRQQLRAAVPMRDSETFQGELGRIAADIAAARAFLQVQAANHWRHALAGTLNDDALLTQATQTAVWLNTTCVRSADACFALGGGSALYETSPLQRRLRDLHVAGQHAVAQQRQYVGGGKLLLNSFAVSPTVASSLPREAHNVHTLARRLETI
ncbi:MAG TPA: acyl-CoA dehydrogenase family protein [Pseudolabrys sp.]